MASVKGVPKKRANEIMKAFSGAGLSVKSMQLTAKKRVRVCFLDVEGCSAQIYTALKSRDARSGDKNMVTDAKRALHAQAQAVNDNNQGDKSPASHRTIDM